MTDPKDKPDQDSLSDSLELFENLFKELPLEEEKKTKQAPRVAKDVKPAPELRRKPQVQPKQPPRPKQEALPVRQASRGVTDAEAPGRRVDFSRTERKARPTPPPSKPRPTENPSELGPVGARTGETQGTAIPLRSERSPSKGRKSSRGLKMVLLLLLLVAGGAAAASHLGFVDFSRYISWFAGEEPQPVAPQVVRRGPEKRPAQQVPVRPALEKAEPQPAPQEAAVPSGEPIAQLPVIRQERASSMDQPAKAETHAPVPAPPQEPPTLPRPESAGPPGQQAVTPQVPQQVTQVPPAAKDLAPAAAPPQKQPLPQQPPAQYPFSVYLGSQSSLDLARRAVSIYEKDYGISPYWVRVDLGEKGLWYRIFAGHFKTEQEAGAFIRQKQLKSGEVKRTRFSNLIGMYSSQGEAAETVRKLSALGYSSYAVSDPGAEFRLYSGVFYTEEDARRQNAELASKGIKSKVVER